MRTQTKFIRFVVIEPHITPKYVWGDPWWSTGIITIAQELLSKQQLSTEEQAQVKNIFAWLNENIPCPPFSQKLRKGIWSRDAVSWFYFHARAPIRKMRPLIKILRLHKCRVGTLQTDYPGKIVYRDKFQVVAETPKIKWTKRRNSQ